MNLRPQDKEHYVSKLREIKSSLWDLKVCLEKIRDGELSGNELRSSVIEQIGFAESGREKLKSVEEFIDCRISN